MIVGTRLLNGKIAHFEVIARDYKDARNRVLQGMVEIGEFEEHTPFLVSIPDCGKNLRVSVSVTKTVSKDPLKGALSTITTLFRGLIAPEPEKGSGGAVDGLRDQVEE